MFPCPWALCFHNTASIAGSMDLFPTEFPGIKNSANVPVSLCSSVSRTQSPDNLYDVGLLPEEEQHAQKGNVTT